MSLLLQDYAVTLHDDGTVTTNLRLPDVGNVSPAGGRKVGTYSPDPSGAGWLFKGDDGSTKLARSRERLEFLAQQAAQRLTFRSGEYF